MTVSRSHVATRRADDGARCAAQRGELGAMKLGDPVHRRRQQLGPRVVEVVPARIVGGVVEAEVRPEVDDRLPAIEELVDPARNDAVGERQEDRLGIVGDSIDDVQLAGREVGMDAREGIALPVTPDEPDDPDVRVERKEADQLGADVARRTDDGNSYGIAGFQRAGAAGRRGSGGGRVLGSEMTVRRGRRARRVGAHGRTGPLAGGRLDGSETGRNVVTA